MKCLHIILVLFIILPHILIGRSSGVYRAVWVELSICVNGLPGYRRSMQISQKSHTEGPCRVSVAFPCRPECTLASIFSKLPRQILELSRPLTAALTSGDAQNLGKIRQA